MTKHLSIVIDCYRNSRLSWKFMIEEINVMMIIFGFFPVFTLFVSLRIVNSFWIAIIILLNIIIHYIIYYVATKEKLSKFDDKYKDNITILNFYLIENSKYWTKYRFQKFMSEIEKQCKDNNCDTLTLLQSSSQYIKNIVELSDKKEKIVASPRRSLMLWFLAPVIGIFTAIFQDITKHAISQPFIFVVVLTTAYLFFTLVFIIFEIIKREYNSDYQKLELLNFIECGQILLTSHSKLRP